MVFPQAFTCLAVPEGIQATGATPTFVDIEPAGFNMDPSALKASLTSRSRAIVVQHTFGIPAQLDRIVKISAQAEVPLIEDCCHTLRSRYGGRLVGTFGAASFYSYEWGKPVIVGIGGSARANDEDLDNRIASMYHGFRPPSAVRQLRIETQYLAFQVLYRPGTYWPLKKLWSAFSSAGAIEGNFHEVQTDGEPAEDFQLRMADRHQRRLHRMMRSIDSLVVHNRWLVKQYQSRIESSTVLHPVILERADAVYARYPLRVEGKDDLLQAAARSNVELSDFYETPVDPLPREQRHLVNYKAGSCPEAESRAKEVVSLPMHPRVTAAYVEQAAVLLN